jgi:hypothetical protein
MTQSLVIMCEDNREYGEKPPLSLSLVLSFSLVLSLSLIKSSRVVFL